MATKTIADLLNQFDPHEDSGLEVQILAVIHTPDGDYALGFFPSSFADKEEAESYIAAHPERFKGGTDAAPVTYHVIEIETGSYKRMREL